MAQDAQKGFPKLVAMSSNQINHRRENSVDSNQSDDDGYDIFTFQNRFARHPCCRYMYSIPLSEKFESNRTFNYSFFSKHYFIPTAPANYL